MESPVQKVEAENDQLLVDRARLGDRHAFDLLVLKYQSRLLSLVNRLVSNQSDALDVLQDTFVKAYRSLHTFRGESAFYTWLYRIAVNTAKNHLASKLKEAKDISVDDEGTGELSVLQDFSAPDQEAGAEELQRAILHAIEQLADDLKQALTLRELEGNQVLARTIETYNNTFVRQGTVIINTKRHTEGLIRYINKKFQKEMREVK